MDDSNIQTGSTYDLFERGFISNIAYLALEYSNSKISWKSCLQKVKKISKSYKIFI